MNKDSLASESPSMLSVDGNSTNNSSGSESVEETTSDIYDGFLKAVSDGSCLDIISQHIENLERDIAATSSTEVKSKLSKYSSSNLTDMRAAIIKYCKQKLPNMPKGKPSRRLNRQGGRTAIDKLAADIIVLIKLCSSGVITSELIDMFPKQPNHGEQSLLNMTDNQSSITACGKDECNAQLVNTFLEEMDVKFYNMKEDFDESVLNLRSEIAELKKDMCNKDAKIESLKRENTELKEKLCEKHAKVCSLESEWAVFKGNYKFNKTFVSDNLEGQKAQLQGQQVNLDKLEDKFVKLSKDFDKLKKQLNTNKRSVEAVITRELIPTQSISTKQLPNSHANKTKQNDKEIQSPVANRNVEDLNAHSGAVNTARDSNAFVSKAGASISLNHQSEQIAQHSCVVEPRESNLSGADSKEDNESSEEMDFVGVQKHKVRRLYLGGVREGVNEQTITNYMQKRGISPTFMRLFKSKRKGTVAVRVNVKSADFERVSDNEFWPKHVYAREWLSKAKWLNKNNTDA